MFGDGAGVIDYVYIQSNVFYVTINNEHYVHPCFNYEQNHQFSYTDWPKNPHFQSLFPPSLRVRLGFEIKMAVELK